MTFFANQNIEQMTSLYNNLKDIVFNKLLGGEIKKMKMQGMCKRVISFIFFVVVMLLFMGVTTPITARADSEKKIISYPVTFKVVGGGWNKDGSTEDIVVVLSRSEDEDLALVLKPEDIPAAGERPAANYKKQGSWDETPNTDTQFTKATTYTYYYTAKTTITPKVSMSGYAYGSPSTPSISGNTGNGAVTYFYSTKNQSSGGTKWEISAPPELNAGSYYMYAEVAETDDYASAVTQPVAFMVSNAGQAVIVKLPTANNRSYDGTEKPLLNRDGAAEGGTLAYALGEDATTEPNASAYTESIPVARSVGSYYVWCKAAGDENHTDSEAACVEAEISEAYTPSITLDAATLSLKQGTEETLTATVVPEKHQRMGQSRSRPLSGSLFTRW